MESKRLKIMLFVYNFKHKKSVDFIHKLVEENIYIDAIVAADYFKIKRPKKAINFSPFFSCSEHPKDVANKLDIPYYALNHDNEEILDVVTKHSIDLGIIAGARILRYKIIQFFNRGIINFHPGLLPECRGLDSMFWSIYNNYPLGVTSHLINEKIDCGKLILKTKIKLSLDDNLISINKKIYNLQLALIKPTLKKIQDNLELIDLDDSIANNSYMSELLQKEVIKKTISYVKNFSN